MYNRPFTPEFITVLKPNEIFVFGSNLQGMHGGGAARMAYEQFGAVMGQGVGLQGQSYAIPTMQGGVETIEPYVDEFIAFAKSHPEYTFLVTPIGCGIAGFMAEEIAPLFYHAMDVENIILPEDFAEIVNELHERFIDSFDHDSDRNMDQYLNTMEPDRFACLYGPPPVTWDASDPDSHNSGSIKPSILSKWIKKILSSNSRN